MLKGGRIARGRTGLRGHQTALPAGKHTSHRGQAGSGAMKTVATRALNLLALVRLCAFVTMFFRRFLFFLAVQVCRLNPVSESSNGFSKLNAFQRIPPC